MVLINYEIAKDIKVGSIEINSLCRPHSQDLSYFVEKMVDLLNYYSP